MLNLNEPNALPYLIQQLKKMFVAKELGKVLSSNDYTDEDKTKVDGIDSAIKEAVGEIEVPPGYVPNLLDNSDFRNPINQRGLSSYTGSYGIDRWRVWGAGVLTVGNGCISVANDSAFQYLPQSAVKNEMHTLAAKKTDGTLLIHSANPLSAFAWAKNGLGLGLDGNVVVGLPVGEYEWAALYEGEYTAETLPPYHSKGFGAELRECQRYYYQSWLHADGFNDHGPAERAASTWGIPASIYFPVEMRIKPTVTLYSPAGTVNAITAWGGAEVTANANRIGKLRFGIGASGTLTVNTVYVFHFAASADL